MFYYSLNLYTYCHNNPTINVDPSGHKIQLKGTKDDKDTVLTEMQKLTDHKLAYNKKGYVYISEYAYAYNPFLTFLGRKYPRNLHDAKYLSSNQLIESMLESKKTTSIVVDKDLNNGHTDFTNTEYASKSGSDAVITFNPDFSSEIYVQNPRSKYLELEASDPYIVLVHEMIHADRGMKGHFKAKGTIMHRFFVKYYNILWCRREDYDYEKVSLEEAETVGFSGSFDINENMIRKEHGIKLRGKYFK